MATVQLSYYSDILCIWAYVAQRRLEALVEKFGAALAIESRFCPVFSDAWGKIETNWKHRGGFEGFNRHINEVARKFPHIEGHERLWLQTRPRSSASAHLFVKAVELVEADASGGEAEQPPYFDRLSTRVSWELRRAFFVSAKDVSDWRIQEEIADRLGIDYSDVDRKIRSSEALARLAADDQMSRKHGAEGSPTFLLNEGRQKLFGNVGYRLLEANVHELFHNTAANQASWC
ncbi:DsbA family oxidoreductase [Aurantimonas marianensis]|uniref:DsbA family protein n=1 Tax=Aurantimonas marianensis TaxID=2920428 RepID=A0A9X2HC50_9HYPH|nr:DsbA family protein [Aurantimonas marianensis]MCP3056928.1 DsbA family protein [Aurantimonas marianensis]